MGKRSNGEGSIHERKDGRYEARFYVLMPDGTQKRRSICGKYRDDVASKMNEELGKSQQGIPAESTDWTVESFLKHWLKDVKRVRKYRTYQGYESVCRNHLIPILGKKKLHKLSVVNVKRLIATVENMCLCCFHRSDHNRPEEKRRCCAVEKCCHKRASARLIQQVHSVLRAALNAAMREELIRRNVAGLVQVTTPDYDVEHGLSLAQARQLFTLVEDDRFHALYVLALYMGFRRGELFGLRWEHIDFERRTISVKRTLQRSEGGLKTGTPKTRKSRRILPLIDTCAEALVKHQMRQELERLTADHWTETGYVFTSIIGTPFEPDNIRRSWHPLREELGLGDLPFHDLRHTCVTLLLDEGVPPHIVQAIAGHANLKVTMDIYAHTNLDTMRAGIQRLDDSLNKPSHG
jgi:integrase